MKRIIHTLFRRLRSVASKESQAKCLVDQTNRLIKFSDMELDLDAAVLRSGVKHGTRFSAAAKSVVSVAV